ncbi:unnamed protein product [Urochloa decumbens]|uniref:Uncharacterized protein n=1 Tax=Urochloa decumbens TaxID=240449 RepID=A0ABC9FZV2_9POAL
MRCLVSPSPSSLSAASMTARPPAVGTLRILPAGLRARCSPRLELLRRPGETAALLRPRCMDARAQNHDNMEPQFKPNYFVEERKHIWERYVEIHYTNEGCLYSEAVDMSAQVCELALRAIYSASKVVDNPCFTSCPPNVISADTIHMTLKAYVDVFLRTAEHSYHRTVMKETVLSFLNALTGLVSISHILLEASLEALSHTHPRESLSEYAYNSDVKTMHREFKWQMSDLEDGIENTSTFQEVCQLMLPTILKGVRVTKSFLGLMAARRQRALGKASKVV